LTAEILQSQNQNVANNHHQNAAAAANSVGAASMLTTSITSKNSASNNNAALSASLNVGSSVKTSHSAVPIKQNENNKNEIRPRLVTIKLFSNQIFYLLIYVSFL